MAVRKPRKPRPITMKFEVLKRLEFRNSPLLPHRIVHEGVVKEWTGIGWIVPNDQTKDGKETYVDG